MLEVRHVRFAYGRAVAAAESAVPEPLGDAPAPFALDEVSFSVAPGERVALIGPNGSGKSTLVGLLGAALAPASGSVTVDGVNPWAGRSERFAVRRLVGVVRQDPALQLVSTVVADDVAFGPRNLGLDPREVERRVRAALDVVGLSDVTQRDVSSLSGGQQQRLSLAGVLAMEPRYLVLDEATSMLDSAARQEMRSLCERLSSEKGIGIVQVTHDPLEALSADCIVVLEGGAVCAAGTPGELARSNADVLARELYLGAYGSYVLAARRAGYLGRGVEPGDLAGWLCAQSCEARGRIQADAAAWRGADGTAFGASDGLSQQPKSGASRAADGLRLEHVSFGYDEADVLSDVSLDVAGGELVLVAGPSGSGKSTLARIAAGLYEPARGSVTCAGAAVRPGDVGIAFQRPEDQLFLNTVWDDIAFAPRNRGLDDEEVARCVEEARLMVGLDEDLLGRYPVTLSGGQARRAALAGVVALRPYAYVFDEPTAGLDCAGKRFIVALARTMARAGAPVVVVSHDLAEWFEVADRVVLISHGRVAWEGETTLLESSSDAFASAGIEPPEWARLRQACPWLTNERRAPLQGASACRKASCAGGAAAQAPQPRDGRRKQGKSPTAMRAFGSFTAPDAPLARVDARAKLALLLMVTVAAFVVPAPAGLVALAALLVFTAHAARVTPLSFARALRPASFILAFSLLANALRVDGSGQFALLGPVGFDLAGAARGAVAVARIGLLVGFALTISASTTPTALADACTRLLWPLKRLGLPSAEIGMTVSVALRFVPLVSEELERIRLAQRSRGARFDEGGVLARVRAWASVVTPLAVSLFRRADALGESMESRCFGAADQSALAPLALAARDRVLLVCGVLALAGCALWAMLA